MLFLSIVILLLLSSSDDLVRDEVLSLGGVPLLDVLDLDLLEDVHTLHVLFSCDFSHESFIGLVRLNDPDISRHGASDDLVDIQLLLVLVGKSGDRCKDDIDKLDVERRCEEGRE